jgi:hypothetical protein
MLSAMNGGHPQAAEELLPLLYERRTADGQRYEMRIRGGANTDGEATRGNNYKPDHTLTGPERTRWPIKPKEHK